MTITVKFNMVKPTASTLKQSGIELTSDKDGQVKPKAVSEFSKDDGVVTPIPVASLVELAFPVKSALTYCTDTVFDKMISELSNELSFRAGTVWKDRLFDVAGRLYQSPETVTTLSDEAVHVIMRAIEMLGSTDVSRQPKQVIKEAKLDAATLSTMASIEESFAGVDLDLDDFSLDDL